MSKKFLIFDVDNTITENLMEISQEMADVLNNLDEEIAFISGTNISELKRMISSKLNRRHHLLGNMGTHYIIVENGDEKEIIKKELTSEEKQNIISTLKKLKEKYSLVPLTSEEDQILDRGSQITLSILGRTADSEKKNNYDSNKEKRKEFIDYLRNFIGDNYEMSIGGTTSIDITKKGTNKGDSLIEFSEINHIPKENITFFGDQLQPGGNDYSVKEKGFNCIEVKNPMETIRFLNEISQE